MRRLIVISIINIQWSSIEYEIIKGTKKHEILSNPILIIKQNFHQGKQSTVVPINIRFRYIRSTIQKFNTEYSIKYLKYIKDRDTKLHEYKKQLHHINAQRIISGNKALENEECPNLPLPPYKVIFISILFIRAH